MSIFKKHSTALVVLIAVIIIGTLFGVHRSSRQASKRIEAQFYDGVFLEDAGYTEASIEDMLHERSNNAMGAVSLAANYGELREPARALSDARNQLLDSHTIGEKYIANSSLSKSADSLRKALGAVSLSERDSEGLLMYLDNMDAAQKVIDSSSYNGVVREFINGTMTRFPVRLLKGLAFCTYPSYFNVEG